MMHIFENKEEYEHSVLGFNTSRRDRRYIIKKTELDSIAKNVESVFEDSNTYLNTDSNIIIGRNPHGPRYENKVLVKHSIVGGLDPSEDRSHLRLDTTHNSGKDMTFGKSPAKKFFNNFNRN